MTIQTVVVTGSGSGIGRAISHALAERGWQVVATDVETALAEETASTLSTAEGQKHEFAQLNVSDPLQAGAVADDVADRLGLAGWMNNAGISYMERFVEMPLDRFDRTLEVNLKGVFVCGQAAARAMIRTHSRGRIVNTASMAGKQGRVPFLADYVASKFGVVGLTQAMAYELAEFGMTVNSVCPGYVATPMQARELSWEAALRGVTADEVRQMWVDDTPLARLEEPTDVARVVGFLFSEDAAFITGEAIAVNGGAYMD